MLFLITSCSAFGCSLIVCVFFFVYEICDCVADLRISQCMGFGASASAHVSLRCFTGHSRDEVKTSRLSNLDPPKYLRKWDVTPTATCTCTHCSRYLETPRSCKRFLCNNRPERGDFWLCESHVGAYVNKETPCHNGYFGLQFSTCPRRWWPVSAMRTLDTAD